MITIIIVIIIIIIIVIIIIIIIIVIKIIIIISSSSLMKITILINIISRAPRQITEAAKDKAVSWRERRSMSGGRWRAKGVLYRS